MLPPIVSTSSLTDSAGINTVEVQVGYASATCAGGTATIGNVHACSRAAQTVDDDPSTAVTGNQVTGTFGLSLVDTNGTTYTGIASDLYVADSSGYALSASTLETYLNTDSSWFSQRNAGYDTVRVSRSAVPNSAMGYTYTVTFVKENVGGNVDAFSTVTTALTATATASSSLGVGDIASDGSYVVNKGITITEVVTGAQLQGSFQLTFNGYTTGPLNYDASATVVENALNDLTSISPSRVTVSRDGPMYNPTTQVKGYVWSITFNSNTWVDPTTDHSTYLSGNWFGSATTRTDTWPSGYSKAWGKNVGDQPMIVCVDSSLYVTGTGALPSDGCLVEEVEKGTPPLAGTFTLSLDTTSHAVIAVQAVNTTNAISHNAPADAVASGGDGTSMAEILMDELMYNIGDLEVSRSAVNPATGGYTWTITFLRDRGSLPMAGQHGSYDCEQRDSEYNLCNSPGDVPKLTFDDSLLYNSAWSHDKFNANCRVDEAGDSCAKITVMDEADRSTPVRPPGSKTRQRIIISNPSYSSAFATDTNDGLMQAFSIAIQNKDDNNDVETLACGSSTSAHVHMTPGELNSAIDTLGFSWLNLNITESLDDVRAKNGKIFNIFYHDEGFHPLMTVVPCTNVYDGSVTDPLAGSGL